MFLYQTIAKEWDKLIQQSKEEFEELDASIEDGVFEAFAQFNFQLIGELEEKTKDLEVILNDFNSLEKVGNVIRNAIYSGYLIYVAYQKISHIQRPSMAYGIEYNPTLMEEYNETIAPLEPNEKNIEYNKLLDFEPALELLIDRVANIEMNILIRNFPEIELLPYKFGYLANKLIKRAVFIGFGIGYVENNLRK